MKHQCNNCHEIFMIPSKQTIVDLTHPNVTRESATCPFCTCLTFTEYIEPASTVESVYIYELTSGPQTELNGLLAQGYVIVNRYAKAYHLEKPKDTGMELQKGIEATQQIAESSFDKAAADAYKKLEGTQA